LPTGQLQVILRQLLAHKKTEVTDWCRGNGI
jgi:hypothetical protein